MLLNKRAMTQQRLPNHLQSLLLLTGEPLPQPQRSALASTHTRKCEIKPFRVTASRDNS